MSPQTPSPDEARELAERLDAMLTGRPRFHDDQALMWAVMAIRSLAREVEALRRVEKAARAYFGKDGDPTQIHGNVDDLWAMYWALSALNTEEPTVQEEKP